jgi:hypothetical protein
VSFCQPCLDRGRKSESFRDVAGTPMCRNCFSGKPVKRVELLENLERKWAQVAPVARVTNVTSKKPEPETCRQFARIPPHQYPRVYPARGMKSHTRLGSKTTKGASIRPSYARLASYIEDCFISLITWRTPRTIAHDMFNVRCAKKEDAWYRSVQEAREAIHRQRAEEWKRAHPDGKPIWSETLRVCADLRCGRSLVIQIPSGEEPGRYRSRLNGMLRIMRPTCLFRWSIAIPTKGALRITKKGKFSNAF